MTPLSNFVAPAEERTKLLKKEKNGVWRRKKREIINEKKRQWRERTKAHANALTSDAVDETFVPS